jgi:hypothetical protein
VVNIGSASKGSHQRATSRWRDNPHHFAVHHPRLLFNGVDEQLTLQIYFDFFGRCGPLTSNSGFPVILGQQ